MFNGVPGDRSSRRHPAANVMRKLVIIHHTSLPLYHVDHFNRSDDEALEVECFFCVCISSYRYLELKRLQTPLEMTKHCPQGPLTSANGSRASAAIRLEREGGSNNGSNDENCSAHIERRRRCCVGKGRDNRRNNTHDTIACHSNSVARRPVCAGKNLWRVCVKRSIINVEEACNEASKRQILRRRLHGRIRPEEGHCRQRTDNHGVLAAQQLRITHVRSNDWTGDSADVCNGVVAPSLKGGVVKL